MTYVLLIIAACAAYIAIMSCVIATTRGHDNKLDHHGRIPMKGGHNPPRVSKPSYTPKITYWTPDGGRWQAHHNTLRAGECSDPFINAWKPCPSPPPPARIPRAGMSNPSPTIRTGTYNPPPDGQPPAPPKPPRFLV